MDTIKKFWPIPFKVTKGDTSSFIVNLIVFIVICAIGGIAIGVLNMLVPFLSVIWWILGSLLELYGFIGIILCIIRFVTDAI